MSVNELADMLGMLQNNLSAIINNTKGTSIPTLKLIAEKLEVPIYELFSGYKANSNEPISLILDGNLHRFNSIDELKEYTNSL